LLRFIFILYLGSVNLCKECGADHVVDYSKSDVVAEVLKLTNNEGVDVSVDTTNVPSSFLQSSSVVKKDGKWICVQTAWGDDHQAALAKCKEKGVDAQFSDYGRYWFLPQYQARTKQDVSHMLASCDKLFSSGVSVKIAKVIPFELEKIKEEVLAVGQTQRFGKVVIDISGKSAK
jgi:NADPH:quinone reductase-like Zn-dependent oxidoreductase